MSALPFSGSSDTSPAIDGTVGAFLGLTWIAVSLRIYVRAFILKKLQSADYLIVLTQILNTVQAAFIFIGVIGGIGNSRFLPTASNIAHALENQLLIELFFCITSTLLRISIALQLWPIITICPSPTSRRFQSYIVICACAIMVLFGIAWFFTLLFQCNPIAFFWNQVYNVFYGQMLYEGNCRSNAVEAGMAYTQAILSAGSDFVLGLLPIWIVWNVAMAKKLKISVAGLLGIGISAGVVAFVRLVYTHHLIFASNNFFGDPSPVIICAFLEVSLGVLGACIATYKPLFSKGQRKRLAETGQSTTLYVSNQEGSKV